MLTKDQALKFMAYRVLMLEQANTLEDLYTLEEMAVNDLNYISRQRVMPPVEVGTERRRVEATTNHRAGELEREAMASKTVCLALGRMMRPAAAGGAR